MVLNDDKNKTYNIGGVMQDLPTTSHLQYDFLLTMTGYQLWDGEQAQWSSSNYPTYVLLKPGTNAGRFESKLQLILTKYYMPMAEKSGDKGFVNTIKTAKLVAQPITDIYLTLMMDYLKETYVLCGSLALLLVLYSLSHASISSISLQQNLRTVLKK